MPTSWRRNGCVSADAAAEYQTLPEPMRRAVVRFFDDNESSVAAVLDEGRRSGVFHIQGSTRDAARVIVSGLEGAMLVTRLHGDPQAFQMAAERLVADVVGWPLAALPTGFGRRR